MEHISDEIALFAEKEKEETLQLLKSLTIIPAPTGKEAARAVFIRDWLQQQKIGSPQIDEAGNVVCMLADTSWQKENLIVVMAHMDTVFTETEPFAITEDGSIWRAPGIGDDTANLVNMLMAMRFLWQHQKEIKQEYGLLFVANVGEEGLGNLKGSRQIYADYQNRIRKWASIDLYYNGMHNRAVGSCRYEIRVQTEGGHSFGNFGNANAIAELAQIIDKLYQQQVPLSAKTTYNVGMISGGTSVNTIAQEAVCLYEFRSESNDGLAVMKDSFERIIKEARSERVVITVTELGVRPGNGDVDPLEEQKLCDKILKCVRKYYDGEVTISSASTDCNIPLSHGIPAVCFGAVMGAGLHTKEEWIDKDSMVTGQKIAIESMISLCE